MEGLRQTRKSMELGLGRAQSGGRASGKTHADTECRKTARAAKG